MNSETVDHSVLDLPQIVIHGNAARAEQLGYGKDGVAISEGISADIANNVYNAFGMSGDHLSHFYGNPAFCMHLKLKDFFATYDNRYGCTIESCGVCKFPMNDDQWGLGWDARYGSVGTEGFDKSKCYCNFKPSFSVNLYVIEDETIVQTLQLFRKDSHTAGGPTQWNVDGIDDFGNKHMAYPENSKLSFSLSGRENPVILAIGMYASCSCNQAGKHRPVFATKINEYIPEVRPYVWKFEEDRKWHLTRPAYITESVGAWSNIEDVIKEANKNS